MKSVNVRLLNILDWSINKYIQHKASHPQRTKQDIQFLQRFSSYKMLWIKQYSTKFHNVVEVQDC